MELGTSYFVTYNVTIRGKVAHVCYVAIAI
jgi:hypothetical protein